MQVNRYHSVTKYSENKITHHTLSSKEVRDDLFINVVHKTARALVVISCIDQKLLSCILINEWAHL